MKIAMIAVALVAGVCSVFADVQQKATVEEQCAGAMTTAELEACFWDTSAPGSAHFGADMTSCSSGDCWVCGTRGGDGQTTCVTVTMNASCSCTLIRRASGTTNCSESGQCSYVH